MQRLGGLLLILAGAAFGTYTFVPSPFEGQRPMTRVSAANPDSALADANSGDGTVNETVIVRTPPPRLSEKTAVASLDNRPAATWSAIVTSDASQQARITSSRAGDRETRAQLARDLQTELMRVGCYAGEINGAWTGSSKRAMSTFMERVNATLPIDEPDYILLTLVQGHAAIACGGGCPSGQTADGDGRCVPQGVVAARASKKAKPVQEASLRDRSSDVTGRNLASVAAGRAEAKPGRGDDSEQIAQAGGERLPWLDDDTTSSITAPAPRAVHRPDGMMAVGAPVDAAALDTLEDSSPVTVKPAPRSKTIQRSETSSSLRDAAVVPPSKPTAYAFPGTKGGPAAVRAKTAAKIGMPKAVKHKAQAVRRPAPYLPAMRIAKPKSYFFASSSRRSLARPGTPSFRMLQAMGGVY